MCVCRCECFRGLTMGLTDGVVFVCIRVHAHLYVRMCIHIHVCVCVCVFVCACVYRCSRLLCRIISGCKTRSDRRRFCCK